MTGLMVAGTASGVGKTTVALAIMAALKRRGLTVQPFKGGPDFLDTGHHSRICGRVARNLDTWMLNAEANYAVLQQAARGADAIVVEGMMGVFDGKDGNTEIGSSAEIAKLLKLPVVLVVDAAKSARSIAAVVLGFESFDPGLPLAGVILNRVASDRHFQMLQTAIQSKCKTKILGWLPREPTITIPERHLGLRSAEEQFAAGGHDSAKEQLEKQIDQLAAMAEKHFDLDALLQLECGLPLTDAHVPSSATYLSSRENVLPTLRVGVARDRAFSFYYEDNLDLLREHGAQIIPFSPLDDAGLPPNLDALYLGGGYPELHARQLSGNRQMLDEIHQFVSSGRPIYAECGGMLYLSHSLQSSDGTVYPMVDIFPFTMEMTGKLVQFGYVTVEFTRDCLLGPKGTVVRGHSFHYSRIAAQPEIETSYKVQYSLSGKQELEGFYHGSVLASYIHLHFRADPTVAHAFMENIRKAQVLQAISA